jgi:hypothetical protein
MTPNSRTFRPDTRLTSTPRLEMLTDDVPPYTGRITAKSRAHMEGCGPRRMHAGSGMAASVRPHGQTFPCADRTPPRMPASATLVTASGGTSQVEQRSLDIEPPRRILLW